MSGKAYGIEIGPDGNKGWDLFCSPECLQKVHPGEIAVNVFSKDDCPRSPDLTYCFACGYYMFES